MNISLQFGCGVMDNPVWRVGVALDLMCLYDFVFSRKFLVIPTITVLLNFTWPIKEWLLVIVLLCRYNPLASFMVC